MNIVLFVTYHLHEVSGFRKGYTLVPGYWGKDKRMDRSERKTRKTMKTRKKT
jgi:hypothetical protein